MDLVASPLGYDLGWGTRMVEKTMELRYFKSPQWRAISASSVSVNAIGGPIGLEFIMRFTYEWVDLEKETFTAEVTKTGGGPGDTITVKGVPTVTQTPLFKVEDVAVRMPTEGATSLVATLLTQFSQLGQPHKLTDLQKKRIQDAYAAFQTS
jgi:hypothetical protein